MDADPGENTVIETIRAKTGDTHCIGCMMAHGETLEQACEVHGISADKLVELINQYEAGKTAPAAE